MQFFSTSMWFFILIWDSKFAFFPKEVLNSHVLKTIFSYNEITFFQSSKKIKKIIDFNLLILVESHMQHLGQMRKKIIFSILVPHFIKYAYLINGISNLKYFSDVLFIFKMNRNVLCSFSWNIFPLLDYN